MVAHSVVFCGFLAAICGFATTHRLPDYNSNGNKYEHWIEPYIVNRYRTHHRGPILEPLSSASHGTESAEINPVQESQQQDIASTETEAKDVNILAWLVVEDIDASAETKAKDVDAQAGITAKDMAELEGIKTNDIDAPAGIKDEEIVAPEGTEAKDIDAFARIEAEDNDYNVSVQLVSHDGGVVVGYINQGDVIGFRRVNFQDGASGVLLRVSSGNPLHSPTRVHLCLDSADNEPLVTVDVDSTGGWSKFRTLRLFLPTTPRGVHDLYLTFSDINANSAIADINWLQFFRKVEDTNQ